MRVKALNDRAANDSSKHAGTILGLKPQMQPDSTIPLIPDGSVSGPTGPRSMNEADMQDTRQQ